MEVSDASKKKDAKPAPKRPTVPSSTKDYQAIREMCTQIQNLATQFHKERTLKGMMDLDTLKRKTDASKQEDEMALLAMEAIVSIVNFSVRKQILRERLMKRMTDERELAAALQAHRDLFTQFLWDRRMESRKEMRSLFQNGIGFITRFGDMIADSTLESIQSFERINWARLCKDKIFAGVCNDEDIPGYFMRQIYLVAPSIRTDVVVHQDRLELHLSSSTEPELGSERPDWGCIYATAGPWRTRLISRPTIREIVRLTQSQIAAHIDQSDQYTFIHLIARLIEAVHPSHQLPAAILSNPSYALAIIKRRLAALEYNLEGWLDDGEPLDAEQAMLIASRVAARLQKEHRFYFEFTTPDKTAWRIGFTSSKNIKASAHSRYPGDDAESFGFASTGELYWKGKATPYITVQDDPLYFGGYKTWGIVVDLYAGHVSLIIDGKSQGVAFGNSASGYERAEQRRQRALILNTELIPTFALKVSEVGGEYAEKPQIRVNFGSAPFLRETDAVPCNEILRHRPTNALETMTVLGPRQDMGETSELEEEERLRMSMDKTAMRVNMAVETQRSFSQFPPSIYRRSLACTRIQRAWRRMRGRRMRAKIREEQYLAACLIQRVARRKLKRLRAVKNEAAHLIQKNWRRLKFIWLALLRCIYQQPIPELHRSATIIQRKWRPWHMYKNSPFAVKYNAKVEDLTKAVNKIIGWWRPLHQRLSEVRRLREKHHAATTIQRVWRGYSLRQLLRPDLRQRLRALGESVARHRMQLLRIHGAYVIQSGWRNFLHKRIRMEKVRTRHRAAARIQALWKGYWVRSHIHLRFSYGEAIFLTAVCKSLRSCHFILKMYRPCGIVCPRREVSYTRDGQAIGKH